MNSQLAIKGLHYPQLYYRATKSSAMISAINDRATIRPLQIAWTIYSVFSITVFSISTCLAQGPTPPMTSSGLNTQISNPITLGGKVQYDITGGTRAGTNIFHSFGKFGIPNNNIANFLNSAGLDTSNILVRVTGGNVSHIFGTIQTTGFGHANLFLMNPAGIVFGPDASLNVGGSATFTTAEYLRLADNERFHVIPNANADALLSTKPVAAYGFLGSTPGTITVLGSQLTVKAGNGISLVGGNITIQSGMLAQGTVQPAVLSAPGGQINLASVASPGEVLAETMAYAPNSKAQSFGTFGTIQITQKTAIDSSGNGGGTVLIRGGNFIIDDSRISANVTGSATGPLGKGIDIQVAHDAVIQNTATLETNVAPDVVDKSTGSGGVRIRADQITITGVPSSKDAFNRKPFTGISSDTEGPGNAGNILLQATRNIEISRVVNLRSRTNASGHGGNIELTSTHGSIQMTRGGKESQGFSRTFINASGNTGNITVSAPEGDIVLDGASLYTRSDGIGRAGQVEITAQNLWMNAGTLGNFTNGPKKPGGITVTLSGTLSLTADSTLVLPERTPPDSLIVTSSISNAPSADINLAAKDIIVTQGSLINSATFASGPGGHLNIVTNTLQVTGGAQISSGSTRAPSRGTLPQSTNPSGAGGDITIQALGPGGSVLIDGPKSGIFADTEGTNIGGTIKLSTEALMIKNGGTISASTTGTDPLAIGGSIIVNAMDRVLLTNGGAISASSIMRPETTNSGIANAGNISINAGQQLVMHNGSSIKTTTESTQANGGNITIQATELVRLVNKSEITTSVKGAEGSGGNIFIDPKMVLLQGSNVTAQAIGGAGGNISFVTPLFFADSASIVSASSQRGVSGTVTIQSPTSNLSGAVGQLVSKLNEPQVLLQNRCAALVGGRESTFVLVGRSTLPPEPGDWLSPSVSIEHWTGENLEHASGLMVHNHGSSKTTTIARDQNKTAVLSLRRLTPSGFLVQTFATNPNGCPS